MSITTRLFGVVVSVLLTASSLWLCQADVPPAADAEQTCVVLNDDTFEAFITDNDVVIIQLHDGPEILAAEMAEAIGRITTATIAYATLDASALADTQRTLSKFGDRDLSQTHEFFAFRFGLLHSSLPRLAKGRSVDDIEDLLVFFAAESSSLADAAAAELLGADGNPLPRWSVYHESLHKFEEILSTADFDEAMAKTVDGDITVVQFFSRYCKFCQLFSYEWHQASAAFVGVTDIKFLRVDGNHVDNAELMERYAVTGYPTIKFFNGGAYESTFTGERKADVLEEAVREIRQNSNVKKRHQDGSFNLDANRAGMLRDLDLMLKSGKLSQAQYEERRQMLLPSGVTA